MSTNAVLSSTPQRASRARRLIDAKGDPVENHRLPRHRQKAITREDADAKLNNSPMARRVLLPHASAQQAHATPERGTGGVQRRRHALFDADTGLPEFIIPLLERTDATSVPTASEFIAEQVHRLTELAHGDDALSRATILNAIALWTWLASKRQRADVELFVIVDASAPTAGDAQRWGTRRGTEVLVQRGPGLTKFIDKADAVRSIFGGRDVKPSWAERGLRDAIRLLHAAGLILAAEPALGRGIEWPGSGRRFQLDPFAGDGNTHVRMATSDQWRDEWREARQVVPEVPTVGEVSDDGSLTAPMRRGRQTR